MDPPVPAIRAPVPGAFGWCLFLVAACGPGPDPDHDGYLAGAGDCDERDPRIHVGVTELCGNLVDDDCDGLVDGEDPGHGSLLEDWSDEDGDGYAGTRATDTCGVPSFSAATDCDDADASVSPAAEETCADGIDNNCDGGSWECPGLGPTEAITSADATYLTPRAMDDGAWARVAGPAGDLTGDGVPDVAIVGGTHRVEFRTYHHYPEATHGAVVLFDGWSRGGLTSDDAVAWWEFSASGAPLVTIATLGDGDGDGLSDLGVATDGTELEDGLRVLSGPLAGDLSRVEPVASWAQSGGYGWFGGAVDRAGDWQGDGIDDLVASSLRREADELEVAVVLPIGGSTGSVEEDASFRVVAPGIDVNGYAQAAGSDWNGDGIGDLAVAMTETRHSDDLRARAWVWEGGRSGVSSLEEADATLVGEGPPGDPITSLCWAEDLEGGSARLAAAAPDPYDPGGRIELFEAPKVPSLAAASAAVILVPGELTQLSVRPAGDPDGDGLPDLAVVTPSQAFVLTPPRRGTADVGDATMTVVPNGGAGIQDAVGAGDLDGDGFAELLVSARWLSGLWLGGPGP